MIDCLSIVKTYKVNHTVEINIVTLVVGIKSFGINADKLDKETGSSDGLQPKQADLSCVHALDEPHLHEIYVFPRLGSEEFIEFRDQKAFLADNSVCGTNHFENLKKVG
nr:hypothetical protein [Tanacetum cinerariifolium]